MDKQFTDHLHTHLATMSSTVLIETPIYETNTLCVIPAFFLISRISFPLYSLTGKIIYVSTSAAYLSAQMAVNNSALRESDGICAATPEQCIANISQIANIGMTNVDFEILRIMLAKRRVIQSEIMRLFPFIRIINFYKNGAIYTGIQKIS